MLFYLMNRNKTVKILRKNASLTKKELADKLSWDISKIEMIERYLLKELSKDIRIQVIPIFRQDDL